MHDPEELVELRRASKAARTPPAPLFDGRRLVALARGDGRSCAELAALAGLSESEVRRLIAAELELEAADRRARVSAESRAFSPSVADRGLPPVANKAAAPRIGAQP